MTTEKEWLSFQPNLLVLLSNYNLSFSIVNKSRNNNLCLSMWAHWGRAFLPCLRGNSLVAWGGIADGIWKSNPLRLPYVKQLSQTAEIHMGLSSLFYLPVCLSVSFSFLLSISLSFSHEHFFLNQHNLLLRNFISSHRGGGS